MLSLLPRKKWMEGRKKNQIKMNSSVTGETLGPQNTKLLSAATEHLQSFNNT